MRKGLLGSMAALLAVTSFAMGEAPLGKGSLPRYDAGPGNVAPGQPAPVTGSAVADASGAPLGCLDGCGCQANDEAPGSLFWARADYLLWWIKHSRVPPLVTTGSPTDLNPGALGRPGTVVLFGGAVDNEERSGGRFMAGLWLNREHTLGVEGGYFCLGQRSVRFTASSAGDAVLARPFFDVTPGSPFENAENVDLLAFPGVASGSAGVQLSSRLESAEANLAAGVASGQSARLTLLGGFRYLRLNEGLRFNESTMFFPGVPVFGGAGINAASDFETRNQFYGGQLGAEAEVRLGRLVVDLRGMCGLGSDHQFVLINGSTTTTSPVGITNTIASGPFALPSNIGTYSRNHFTVVPEAILNVGYQVTDHLRLNVGYTFLGWTDVVRPGNEIDRATNTSQIPPPVGPGVLTGPARPAFSFNPTDFWAQGISFGVEFRY